MGFLPFDRMQITSRLSPEEIREKIKSETEPWQNQFVRGTRGLIHTFRRAFDIKPYPELLLSSFPRFESKVGEKTFTLRYIQEPFGDSRRHFVIVKGEIETIKANTQIILLVRPSLYATMVFIILGLILALLAFMGITKGEIGIAVGSFAFLIILYSFLYFGFNAELKLYQYFIDKLFKA